MNSRVVNWPDPLGARHVMDEDEQKMNCEKQNKKGRSELEEGGKRVRKNKKML